MANKKSWRKWRCGTFCIEDVEQLFDCTSLTGGVWWRTMDRFMNVSWVLSQQFRFLLQRISKREFYYPELNKEEEDVK